MNKKIIFAAKAMDWDQAVLNAAPPCFHLCEDGYFCGRAEIWDGHENKDKGDHAFVPLDVLLSNCLTLAKPEGASGISLIAAERVRQIPPEGWTAEHDEKHDTGELAIAGMCYAAYAGNLLHPYTQGDGDWRTTPPEWWPWGPERWKPTDDPVRALTKAGALIAAELDRLLRASIQPELGYSVHYASCPYEHGGACTCKPATASQMKACLNCGFPKPRCFLCADCWRPAIISPAVVVLVESLVRWIVP